jgi:hypothetical protein
VPDWCIALPIEVFERAYGGETVSAEEEQMFRDHSENGSRLLADISRLGNVSEMIRLQQTITGAIGGMPAERGACALRIAVELDRRMVRLIPFKMALAQLRAIPKGFPQEVLDALDDYSPPTAAFETKRLQAHELRASIILEEDVITKDGKFMILAKGATLSVTLVDRVGNFAKTRGICQPIRVRVVRSDKAQ